MSAQVAADLRAAAEVLRRDGWTQGAYITEDGQCCAVGAVMRAVDPHADPYTDLSDLTSEHRDRVDSAVTVVSHIVAPAWGGTSYLDGPVTRWNDDARTVDEVIAALEAAADAAEAQQ